MPNKSGTNLMRGESLSRDRANLVDFRFDHGTFIGLVRGRAAGRAVRAWPSRAPSSPPPVQCRRSSAVRPNPRTRHICSAVSPLSDRRYTRDPHIIRRHGGGLRSQGNGRAENVSRGIGRSRYRMLRNCVCWVRMVRWGDGFGTALRPAIWDANTAPVDPAGRACGS